MNVNTPLVYTHVDASYLTDGMRKDLWECRIFGAASLPGRAILFHCQLNNGAVYYRLPITAFKDFEERALEYKLHKLQPWDCPSDQMEVITYDWLYNQSVTCLKLHVKGKYITTFDWQGRGTTAEIAHEHKCLHMIKLQNGQYALQPNNYLLWHEKSNVIVDGSHSLLRTNQPYPSCEEHHDTEGSS